MNLTERRKELMLTMKEVGDAIGVSEATISRWESGETASMKINYAAALAKILKVSPLAVIGMESEAEVESLRGQAKAIIDRMDEEKLKAFVTMYGNK